MVKGKKYISKTGKICTFVRYFGYNKCVGLFTCDKTGSSGYCYVKSFKPIDNMFKYKTKILNTYTKKAR